MKRPLGRQIIGAVVFILNSVCPRMGFLVEEKQFKTEKVNCERKLQQSYGNWEMGKFATIAGENKLRTLLKAASEDCARRVTL